MNKTKQTLHVGTEPSSSLNPAIRCCDYTKSYGKHRGVIQLNLEVETGAFYGFLGPNGAGKSTTIRSLLGLIDITGGAVQVLGCDPTISAERKELLSHIGYLPSETQFYPSMRVREVISLSARLHQKNCAQAAELLCEKLELDTSMKVEELSLGNRKKVGIVCAMQHDPDLYILDEPTSGLDPLMQQTFFELLEEKHKEGKTIFFSSHVLSEVQEHCTRAAILREGRLIAEGSIHELMGTNARKVRILLGSPQANPISTPAVQNNVFSHIAAQIQGLSGVSQFSTRKQRIEFLYAGESHELLRLLSSLPDHSIQDITISEPGLEDVFLHYYKEGC